MKEMVGFLVVQLVASFSKIFRNVVDPKIILHLYVKGGISINS